MNILKNKLTWIAVALVAAFLIGRWSGPGDAHDHRAEADETAAAGAEAGPTEWTCSMHPQVRQPEPGPCPICGMDLIPVTADDDPAEEGELPRLSVSARAAALMQVETRPVERRRVEAEHTFFGTVDFDENRIADRVARADGYVEKLYATHRWQFLNAGDPIAAIYSPAVVAAGRELLAAARGAADRGSNRHIDSARAKLGRMGVSDDQIDAILAQREVPRTFQIRSPMDGFVETLGVREGERIADGHQLARVIGLSNLWVQFEAYESDLPWLRVGSPVTFGTQSLPGESFEGEVTFVDPTVDPVKRTVRARVEAANPDGSLKPGMYVSGIIGTPANDEEPPLVIPRSAPLITGKRAVVYVQLPDTERPTFEGRTVTLGPRLGDYYVVRDGLAAGERVVTHGNFKIDSELQIRGRPSMMAPRVEEDPDDPDAVDYREAPAAPAFADEVPASFGEELRPLVRGYLEMAEALADDDYESARGGLSRLHESLLEIGQHRMDGAAHVAWMEHFENLHVQSQRIEAAEDLDGMREHLQDTTREIEEIAVSFGAGQLPELYRMYCPMADDDQGATWLQDNETVSNPYYGPTMLSCGESLGEL